jgi:hypothetical protein
MNKRLPGPRLLFPREIHSGQNVKRGEFEASA